MRFCLKLGWVLLSGSGVCSVRLGRVLTRAHRAQGPHRMGSVGAPNGLAKSVKPDGGSPVTSCAYSPVGGDGGGSGQG